MAFVLENEFCKLECTEKGGEILHLLDKKKNVEVIYQGNEGWGGSNPTLFPMVGNTYSKKYNIHGKEYAMKNHGLIRYATLKGEQKENELVFSLEANDETLARYPFNFHYEIHYSLEKNKIIIRYVIKNEGNEKMPFSFGLHPGFVCPQKEGENFEDYSIQFELAEEAKQLLIDGGRCVKPLEIVPVHLNKWQLSYEDVEKFATIIYKDFKSKYVTLNYKEEPRLKVNFAGFPYLALWTHESRSHFICIEPWFGHGDFDTSCDDFYKREGTIVLDPKEEWATEYSIELM